MLLQSFQSTLKREIRFILEKISVDCYQIVAILIYVA